MPSRSRGLGVPFAHSPMSVVLSRPLRTLPALSPLFRAPPCVAGARRVVMVASAVRAALLSACGGAGDAATGPKGPLPVIVVTVTGLPADTAAALVLTGPSGARPVTASMTLAEQPTGTYRLAALPVSTTYYQYQPFPATATITAARGDTVRWTVQYRAQSARITLPFPVLPAELAADSLLATASVWQNGVSLGSGRLGAIIGNLPPGDYTIRPDSIVRADSVWQPDPREAAVNIPSPQVIGSSVPVVLQQRGLGRKARGFSPGMQSPSRPKGGAVDGRQTHETSLRLLAWVAIMYTVERAFTS